MKRLSSRNMLVGSFLKEMSVSKWTRFMSYEKRAVNTGNKTWITRGIMKSLLLSVRVNRILSNWPLSQITTSPSFLLMCTAGWSETPSFCILLKIWDLIGWMTGCKAVGHRGRIPAVWLQFSYKSITHIATICQKWTKCPLCTRHLLGSAD